MLTYISKKLMNLSRMRRLSRYEQVPGIYIAHQYQPGQSVCVYTKNPLYMHPGDHLFIEPLMRLLTHNGINVSIAPTNTMKPYFAANGYTVVEDASAADFIISRPEMIPEIKLLQKPSLYINTGYDNCLQQRMVEHGAQCRGDAVHFAEIVVGENRDLHHRG